jgi:hypothetical protein
MFMREFIQIFIRFTVSPKVPLKDKKDKKSSDEEEFALCVECGNPIEKCVCV